MSSSGDSRTWMVEALDFEYYESDDFAKAATYATSLVHVLVRLGTLTRERAEEEVVVVDVATCKKQSVRELLSKNRKSGVCDE